MRSCSWLEAFSFVLSNYIILFCRSCFRPLRGLWQCAAAAAVYITPSSARPSVCLLYVRVHRKYGFIGRNWVRQKATRSAFLLARSLARAGREGAKNEAPFLRPYIHPARRPAGRLRGSSLLPSSCPRSAASLSCPSAASPPLLHFGLPNTVQPTLST